MLGSLRPGGLQVVDRSRGGQWLVSTNPIGPIPSVREFLLSELATVPGARFALVGAGRNDLYHVSDEQLRAAVDQLLAQARASGVRIAFLTINPVALTYESRSITEKQRVRFNTWLRTTHPDATIDTDAVLDEDGNGALDNPLDSGDGFHLNAAGSTRVAQAAAAFILRQGWGASGAG